MKPEDEPARVVARPKQAGETFGTTDAKAGALATMFPYAERAVWTPRMLQALATGVKGGRWFSLIDKVQLPANLAAAWKKTLANAGSAGVDGMSVAQFKRKADEYLVRLSSELRDGSYRPKPVRRAYLPKPGTNERRPLGIPTVADRVVQGALRNVIEPIFERKFEPSSYGFRPGRGAKDALRHVEQRLKSDAVWVVDADIRRCFDTIPHAGLMVEVAKEIADGKLLALIEGYLKAGVLEGTDYSETETGTPQGAVMSPLLANIHLHPVDVAFREAGLDLVRYADDLVILCRSQEEAQRALSLLRLQMIERGLELHPEKTRIVDTTKGSFEFLGYQFDRGRRRPRKKSKQNFRDRVRELTPRLDGRGLQARIKRLNLTLIGWFGYFKHSSRGSFKELDGWIRRRLRSMLRKHLGLNGIAHARGVDQSRWPIAFFRQQGLFILTEAHAALMQSKVTR